MNIGPDQIIACPHCKGIAKYKTLLSWSSVGFRVWSDGKQDEPDSARPPSVVKCHQCGQFYWLADAQKVGMGRLWSGEDRQVDPAWATAPQVEEPTEEEYYQAIERDLAKDRQQEKILRVLVWWRRNGAFRLLARLKSREAYLEGGCDPNYVLELQAEQRQVARAAEATSATARRNLEALAELLDDTHDNDRIMNAEVLRELGRFKAAQGVLNRITSPKYGSVVRQIRLLCKSRDVTVRELTGDDEPPGPSIPTKRRWWQFW